jgi:S1-C subfamily serine protease
MKKLILLFIFTPLISLGQTFEDYKYIKLVSNDYDVDIISTAAEMFNRKGFIVLSFDSPKDVTKEPCNILTAKIDYIRGVIEWPVRNGSKLQLSLLDCNNKVIYNRKSEMKINSPKADLFFNFVEVTKDILPRQRISNKRVSSTDDWAGNGSGIIVSKSGYIITNHHVIEDADDIEVEFVLNDEVQKFNAEVVQVDKTNDLAIVKIVDINFDGVNEPPYNFKLKGSDVGTKVYAYGYPMALSIMGKEIKVTDGMISSKTGFDGNITTYQITAPLQGGNSGGPLFDEQANLIGINSSGIRKDIADNVAYSIKTSYVSNLLDILPKSIDLPSSTKVQSLPLTEQIKEISKYVVMIKVK